MKELSIEDKAEAYDEAIIRGSHLWESNTITRENYEYIFPKLQESDNERIRKGIKAALKFEFNDGCRIAPDCDVTREEALKWLEKQDEKVDVIENLDTEFEKQVSHLLASVLSKEYEYTEGFVKWVSNSLLGYAKHEIEKQCEQKPAIKLERDDNGEAVLTPFEAELFSMMSEAWQGYSFGEEVNIAKIVKEHSKELLERANEQKPAWSEEDEERYLSCLRILSTGNIEQPETVNTVWLKSIKERVQSKQELSEDTQQWIDAIIKDYEGLYGINKDFRAIIQIKINILKSLKNRCAWKPSDEQIKGIECAIKTLQHQLNVGDKRLNSLYSDLMKLKE